MEELLLSKNKTYRAVITFTFTLKKQQFLTWFFYTVFAAVKDLTMCFAPSPKQFIVASSKVLMTTI